MRVKSGKKLLLRIAAFCSLGLILPELVLAACAPTAASKILSNKNSYKQDDSLDITYFYETDGNCTGADKPRVKITFNNGSGSLITVGETDCPRPDKGDGMFCELVGAKTFQFRVLTKFNFPGTANKGYLEGWAFNGATLLNKTYPALEVGYEGGSGGGTIPQPAAPAPKEVPPVEANLAVRFGGLAKTSNIALYLATLFNWGIPVISIIAVTMVAWGGFKWLTAGGDSGRVTSAKETITNAIMGLILALAAYLVMNTVNPALTAFKTLEVPKVPRIVTTQETWCEDIVNSNPDFQVSPALGRCGGSGDVTSKSGAQVLTNKCIFKNCPEAEGVCGKVRSADGKIGYQCLNCIELSSDKIANYFNLLPGQVTDGTCSPFTPARPKDGYSFEKCVYSDESKLDGAPGCVRLVVQKCDEVKTQGCAGYVNNTVLVSKKDVSAVPVTSAEIRNPKLNAAKERNCSTARFTGQVCAPTPSDHFRQVCEADPCKVGGCKAMRVESNAAATAGQAVGILFDFWNCVSK